MKHISLIAPAYVGGHFRYPSDGVQRAEDAEADRLIETGLAKDVSDEFTPEALAANGENPDGSEA